MTHLHSVHTVTSEDAHAAANPARVLDLLDENDRLRTAVERATKHRCRPCGCGWCCANVPTDKRGESHQRTCQPHHADELTAALGQDRGGDKGGDRG